MRHPAARALLWVVLLLAYLIAVVFGAAILFGGDTATRLTGAVLTAVAVAVSFPLRAALRRGAPARAQAQPRVRPPDDVERVTEIPGRGRRAGTLMLHLDPSGFEVRHPRRTIRRTWREIESFRTVYISAAVGVRGTPVVGYRIRDDAGIGVIRPWGARFSRFLTGADDTIPGFYERSTAELVEVMERYRQRWS